MDLNRDYQELLQSFASHNVRFLIVGGYALAAHGHPRYTKDLDIWVWTDPSNAERIVKSLESFGFDGLGLTALDFQEPDVVVQLGREPQRVDILTFATGLDFVTAYENRIMVSIGKLEVPFVSIGDLRTNKLATGRLRDIADAADLPPDQE
ncbi:MAG: hypothetical protein O3A24_06755 [Actinobacteria bacterium]|jgi:hypothetical protein|nr:hypothetical protein [Actinomycetota bacterium]MDA2952440.1 hypothetical protein [Actinomycetota bacterium]